MQGPHDLGDSEFRGGGGGGRGGDSDAGGPGGARAPADRRDARMDLRPGAGERGLVRRCRRCGQRLDEVRGHVCPACGEGFDLQDPRTFRVDRLEQVLLLHGNAGKVRMAELTLLRGGIAAVVQDDYNAAGGPTAHLWVARDDVDAAMDVLAAPPVSGSPWTCACGEPHEGQFAECWSCGAERPPAGSLETGQATTGRDRRRRGSEARTEASRGGRIGRLAGGDEAGAEPRTASVPDLEELAAWYATFLGVVPVARSADGIRYEEDGATLLVRPWPAGDLEREGLEDAGSDDPRPVFVLLVDEAESAMERLTGAGAAFVDAAPVPVEGGRSALFIDPFGVVHELLERHVAG